MSTVELEVGESSTQTTQAAPRRTMVAFSGLFFSVLQSICTVAVAIHGLQLMLGVSSLLTAGAAGVMVHFHQITWLRICLLIGALSGSLITLGSTLRARSLRNRPSAQWRRQELTPSQHRTENLQLAFAILTLLLVALEEFLHLRLAHTL